MKVHLFTIGFAETSAEGFFSLLRGAGVRRIIDVRLSNTSQLAGFTKKEDLPFFLRELCGIDYVHLLELAPTQEIMDGFKKQKGSWTVFENSFKNLMKSRALESSVSPKVAHLGCLLCSEKKPERCHRRLVAEYLQQQWPNVSITHLV